MLRTRLRRHRTIAVSLSLVLVAMGIHAPLAQAAGNPPLSAGAGAALVLPGCTSSLAPFGSSAGLVRQPDGVVTLPVTAPPPVAANAGDPATAWTPDPLPMPDSRETVIFYTPHPDDETLSAGVVLATAVRMHKRVIVVAMTDGRDTGAIVRINEQLQARWSREHAGSPDGFEPLTPDEIGIARLDELRRAATALGVAPEDIYPAHLDAPTSDCADIVTVHEADQVERAFVSRFPRAIHMTMSFDAERQQDHLAAGIALQVLATSGVVRRATWTVSRLWWSLPSASWMWVTPIDIGIKRRVQAAAQEYATWNPTRHEYAVGAYSVALQFRALYLDPRNRIHVLGVQTPGYVSSRP